MILDQFINAFQGIVDKQFWGTMIHYQRIISGGEKGLTGWLVAFTPFDKLGNYLLNDLETIKTTNKYTSRINKVQKSVVEVPVLIEDQTDPDGKKTY